MILDLCILNFLTGCATTVPRLKLDASLEKDLRTFSGLEYVPVEGICSAYGLDYGWDAFIQTATIEKGSNRIVLRAGSDLFLANGTDKRLDGPAVLDKAVLYVPTSFVKRELGQATQAPISAPRKAAAIRTIVLDPGHGGRDIGASGRKLRSREKDIALSIAKRVKGSLEREGIRVVMTRDSDIFVPLPKRARMADSSGADLFVSIHINASRSRSQRGFECYYLQDATDDNARALEAFENASLKISGEADAERSRQLDKTLWDMTLSENRIESAQLAGRICDSVEDSFAMGNKGVKSARFYVLKHTHVPAVLVEAGYISNKYDELKLRDPNFLDRIADAVSRGILSYAREYEATGGFTRQ